MIASMFAANAKLPKTMALVSTLLFSQELILFTYTVVIKNGKLQHAAVYDVKFRME